MPISNATKPSHACQETDQAAGTKGGDALALARKLGGRAARAILAYQMVRTIGRVGFAGAIALVVGHMIEGGNVDTQALVGALGSLCLSSFAGLLADVKAARSEADLVGTLRRTLQSSLARMSPKKIRSRAPGAVIAGLQRYPDAVAGLVISHAVAKAMLATGPLLAAAAIAFVSWEAALALLLSLPVMIVFFVLLGSAVRSHAEVQEQAFGRLAAQFADRIRTLPTILANHGLAREHGKMERRMTAYADSTMKVLGMAFLNAGVIDFFAALAIALLAVFLGLGHLGLIHMPGFSDLHLWQSLCILVIAADFFTPFRRYAELYHLKAEGDAAAAELDWYFTPLDRASDRGAERTSLSLPTCGGRVFDPSDLPPAGLIVISGPSGVGKSTLLRQLAGVELPPVGAASSPLLASSCDWISTDVYVPQGTLAEAVGWNRTTQRAAIQRAIEQVGLLDERLLPGGLDACIADGGANLSGGQRMRIGVARSLLADASVLADEPTAKLDADTANIIRHALREMARRRLVIVATHDEQLIAIADQHYVFETQRGKAIAA